MDDEAYDLGGRCKKKIILEYASIFLSTSLKCNRSKRFKLRLTKYIATRTREYSRINNQLFLERLEISIEYNISPTEPITLTRERLAQRASDLTARSKMLEFKHLNTKVIVCMTLLQGRVVLEAEH